MANKFNFTQESLKNIPPSSAGTRQTYYDTTCPGLVLRVTEKGSKTFALQRKIRGRARKIRLGTFGIEGGACIDVREARRLAIEEMAKIGCGRDPQNERNAISRIPTVGAYFDTWLELHGKIDVTETTWKGKQWAFTKHCRSLTEFRLDHIQRDQTRGLLNRIRDQHSPRTANSVRTILNQMYKQAIEDGLLPSNFPIPLHRQFKVPKGRDVFIRPEEMSTFIETLMGYGGCRRNNPDTVRGIILTALFTGQRRGNVFAMRWDEIDWDNGQWTVPPIKAKTRETYAVKLSSIAVQVLRWMQELRQGDCPWVFPQAKDQTKPTRCIRRAWLAIRECAGLTDLRFHDLRRTYGSFQYLATGDIKLLQMNLHHKDIRTTSDIYSPLDSDERLRQAADAGCKSILDRCDGPILRLVGKGDDRDSTLEQAS